ncbi:hypothetical protein AB832_07270 [Flavobacteriaceae bacterium (ex Bugula neritina AB1)]|nr:hypothetical protein AB832_07270 [Flavobacteriaceae bacterium (ex Bugula neritina AB1)]
MNDSVAHRECQEDYRRQGYLPEHRIKFPSGKCVRVDCYDPKTGRVVEIVDTHGDLKKAKFLRECGIDVTWHFVSDKVNRLKYEPFGNVIFDSYYLFKGI